MASNIVRVAVQADSRQLQTAFGEGGTAAEKFSAKMKLVATAVVAALAFKALGAVKDFVGDSVRAFSDLNESLNAVEVMFGKNAEGIKRLGEEAARTVGLSNAEFNSFAVSMSAFAEQIAGPGGDVVGTIETLIGRAADFASVMNISVSEAMEKFQSGLAGQSRPLREYGIDVSDARIKTFAYAEGIAESGEELTEAQKVMARFGTIMEQTDKTAGDFQNTIEDYANAQRVANAEMENAKARAGEALIPVAQLGAQFKLMGAQTLGILATGFQQLTGQLSSTDAAIQEFQVHMGKSADTAESALTINREYDETFADLIPRLSLSRDELIKLRDADEDFLKSVGLTNEEVAELSDVVGVQLASSMTDAERTARMGLTPAMDDLGDETDDTTEALEDQVSAIDEVIAANQRATDPFLQTLEAQRKLKTAQKEYNEALEEFGPDSDEAVEAAGNLIEANASLDGALAKIAEEGGPNWREEFRRVATQAGIAEDTINEMIAAVERADGLTATASINLDISHALRELARLRRAGSRAIPSGLPGGIGLQHGGIVTDPVFGAIGEAGSDEAVIPLNNQGVKILGAALREAMGTGSNGSTPQLVLADGNRLDGASMVKALVEWQRRNGPLPFKIT